MRKVLWIGTSRRDLRAFSQEVRDEIGFALYHAEMDLPHSAIKPMKGFGGGVFEIVADDPGGTYRAVYAVRFADFVYVLHAFHKKSKTGRKTPAPDLALIRQRLTLAALDFKERSRRREKENKPALPDHPD
jgi:phage-related protein